MNVALCTLFEGDYHYGLAALLNSLVRCGAQGRMYAGYRGLLPDWLRACALRPVAGNQHLELAQGFELVLVPLVTDQHFTNYKADFMLRVANELAPEAKAVAYFDPDITMMMNWDLFVDWVLSGITCCADIKPWMPPMHPIRVQWRKLIQELDLNVVSDHFLYFNAGFLGVPRSALSVLDLLRRVTAEVSKRNGRSDLISMSGGRSNPYFLTDQDALNITLMAARWTISWAGPDAMNFELRAGGFMFNHAVNQVKPWRRNYIKDALAGRCVTPADQGFWSSLDGPLRPYSASALNKKRLLLRWVYRWQRFRGVPLHQ